MNQELAHAIAAYYVRSRYTREQLQNFLDNSDDLADKKSLQIALNIQDGKYGKQMEMKFVGK